MRLYVSGTTATLRRLLEANRDHLGVLTSPAAGNAIASIVVFGLPFAVDNGAFTNFLPERFKALVGRAAGQPGLQWVATPDVVADALATLERFHQWQPWLAEVVGVPLAFVGQDGAEDTPIPWDLFQCWFVGGSTRWKLSQASADLCAEARTRGKLVHMGRVNSKRRLYSAYTMGCDSVDGTGLSRWGDVHLAKFVRWLRGIEAQPLLEAT